MSLLSVFYPKRPINLGNHVQSLPDDGTVPFLTNWQYVNTPGHTPGHISLFRVKDRVLIAGDVGNSNPYFVKAFKRSAQIFHARLGGCQRIGN
jgi:glyoxylase-like metal-dependent hydrolase (beta-lactamase superfamily II)